MLQGARRTSPNLVGKEGFKDGSPRVKQATWEKAQAQDREEEILMLITIALMQKLPSTLRPGSQWPPFPILL